MSDTQPPEVRARVDVHLDAVESHLRTAGADRTKWRGIVDDLETQILDMLAAQKKESPSLADVDAVLARLDPPSAYSDKQSWPAEPHSALATARIGEPRLCREAVRGAWCLVASFAGLILVVLEFTAVNMHRGAPPPLAPFWYQALTRGLLVAGAVAAVAGPVLATGLGWVAVERIRGSNGRLYGTALAVIEALLFPLLIIWIATFGFENWLEFIQFGGRAVVGRLTGMEQDKLIAYRVIGIVCAVVLSAGLAWILRTSTGPKRSGGNRAVTQTGSASVLASSTNA
jgi:hypothetical protein